MCTKLEEEVFENIIIFLPYSMSNSGWMETANFQEWFSKVFIPATSDMTKTGPVVLFFDGHKSHESLELIDLARDHNISLYLLPPHTTHLLQPLDVGVFGTLKSVWSQVLKNFKLESMAAKVDRLIFPTLLRRMWERVLLPEHLIGGFRGTGIHPFNREAISASKLKPSSALVPQSEVVSTTSDTPVTTKVLQFFGNLFEEKNNAREILGKRGRTLPRHYGEALTQDEVAERIREEQEMKKRKKEEKKKKPGKKPEETSGRKRR